MDDILHIYAFLSAIADDGTYAPDFADGLAVQRVLAAVAVSDEGEGRVEV